MTVQISLKRNDWITKHWSDVESTQQRSRFWRTNIFPWSWKPGVHSKTMWNKQRCCWQLQNHVWIQNFRWSNWKITVLGKSAYFFVVLWHGRSCQEVCGTILWVGKQDDSTTLQSINSMPWWPPLQRRRIEIRGRIVKYMLSNGSKMLKLGTCCTTWYSMVGEFTCLIDHKMDQSLWQTIVSFDLLHSSYMWVQTILSCRKHCKTMQKQNINPMWKVLVKEVDFGEPTSFFDHVYLGCTQRECETSKDIVDVWLQNLCWSDRKGTLFREIWRRHFLMFLRYGRWCQELCGAILRAGEQNVQQLNEVSTPCLDDHHFKEEEMKSVGELSQVCSQIVLKCLYLARIGRPDILWSVHKLARSITKWTKACDKRVNRLISYIHHTCEYRQYCHVGNTAKQCRLGLFQDSDFAGDLEDSKSTSGGTLCVFGSHTFVPISWMCKKQTSVSHSSTESEIISLDTGLRLDGLPALELWDLIISVFGNISHISDRTEQPVNGKNKSHNKINVIKDIDSVPSNVQSANREALLYVFEDNEAVIKMIMKGRSPTMRHVSRTHWGHVGNTARQCRLGLFQDSDFAGDLEDSKSISGGILCIFGSHTFVPMGWMCKKQTSVSHSSTESEIISLDAGLRMKYSRSWSLGSGSWSVAFYFQPI